jgi:LEA14-like dessication related protein
MRARERRALCYYRGMKSAAVLLLTLALAGCSVFAPKLQSPHLSIVNVEHLGSNFLEQRLRVHIRVENPNDRDLPVSALTYSIEVAGQEFAHGAANESFTVPANGETEFATDVSANMAGALIAILGRGHGSANDSIDYRIVGEVRLAGGFVRKIPFDHQGTFKLQ